MNESSAFTKILVFRKNARILFQKYQTIIELVFKFVISFLAISEIISSLNYVPILDKLVVKLAIGVVGMVLPQIITILMCAGVAMYEIYSASPFLAIISLVVLLVLYCFVARFSGKYAWAVVAIPLLFKFNLQYIVPLLLGMLAGPMTIFPAISGVFVYYVFKVFISAVEIESASVDEVLALFLKVIDDIIKNREMLFTAAIFAAVIVIMWLVRKLRFDFVFEINILIGTSICLIGFFVANLKFDANIKVGGIIGGTLLSVLICCIVQFFYRLLDYTSVENVQFEDDDYYYYVKAVPKIDVAVPEKSVKLFTSIPTREETRDEFSEEDEEDESSEENTDEKTEEKPVTPPGLFEIEPQENHENEVWDVDGEVKEDQQ